MPMQNSMNQVTTERRQLKDEDFAALFGTTEEKIRQSAGFLIDAIDPGYGIIQGSDRDQLILQILKRIHAPDLKNAGDHRKGDWEDGWKQNLEEFVGANFDLSKLIPKYYKSNVPIRLNREYVLPAQCDFVYKYTQIFREWLFKEYFREFESVYEFGCGTGHNLVHLASLYPEKSLYGFDWAYSSERILQLIGSQFGMKIRGGRFNFFDPDETLGFSPGSAVFTFGALEQLGVEHEKFLDFLLRKKPQICIDVVGIFELYNPEDLVDYLAWLYHRRRNYLRGYLASLQELESRGAIRILKIHRQMFGNLYDDPYSYIVWAPGK
jgi:SAM-dependent methyltransferase